MPRGGAHSWTRFHCELFTTRFVQSEGTFFFVAVDRSLMAQSMMQAAPDVPCPAEQIHSARSPAIDNPGFLHGFETGLIQAPRPLTGHEAENRTS